MKRHHVMISLVIALIVCAMASQALASSFLPPFMRNEADTVTISLEEYEALMRYEKLEVLLELVEMYYYKEEDVDVDAMIENAAVGLMAGIGDIYTQYYTPETMAELVEETEGEYAGIGCQLLADPTDALITVTRVFKGSPAEKVGMRSGDKIIYVDDVYYTAYEMNEAVDVMRGEPGGTVKVTVMRGLDTVDFEIVREVVNINYVEYEILEGNIGYVMVYDFLGNAYEVFAEAIAAFEQAGVDGMIIDLRDNGGGLVNVCVDMADLILSEGVVVSMRDKYDVVEEYKIDNQYFDVPMVVLVNEYSASASEILAGAIRDRGAGKLVGTKTFGKGIVQSELMFQDGSGVHITTAYYFTPNGECIHEIGFEPDVNVELDEEAVTMYGLNNLPHGEDAQLQKALEVLKEEMDAKSAAN